MKYLVLNTYPPVAIPLNALAVVPQLIFLEHKYDGKGDKVYWRKDKQPLDGAVIDGSEILPEEPGGEANPESPPPPREEPF